MQQAFPWSSQKLEPPVVATQICTSANIYCTFTSRRVCSPCPDTPTSLEENVVNTLRGHDPEILNAGRYGIWSMAAFLPSPGGFHDIPRGRKGANLNLGKASGGVRKPLPSGSGHEEESQFFFSIGIKLQEFRSDILPVHISHDHLATDH